MKTTYTKFILLLAATTFIACNEEEAPSLHISASADKTEVKVGEPVTFSIRHYKTTIIALSIRKLHRIIVTLPIHPPVPLPLQTISQKL